MNRFGGNHVEGRCGDLSGIQGIRQILLNDQLSPAVVDEDHAVFHLGDIGAVDDSFCGGKEGAVQEDHIRLSKQCIKLNILRKFSAAV